jgi:DeoR/GlpR family transcriptional regulator of sugar metabolism
MQKRQDALLNFLCDRETANVGELAENFGVSKMTIHRDLDRLADLRLVRKVRGGVTVLPSLVFEANYYYRARRDRMQKQVLARYIADEIESGMTLMLDDSSTTAELLEFLPERTPLTVISNARRVIETLVTDDRFTVISLGGCYDAATDAFLGLSCELAVERLNADLAVFSAASVHNGRAYLNYDALVRVKRAMLTCASRSVLAVDLSKFRKSALHLFEPLKSFDQVVTVEGVDHDVLDALHAGDVPVELVASPANEATLNEDQIT